jgi:hypothetical protein
MRTRSARFTTCGRRREKSVTPITVAPSGTREAASRRAKDALGEEPGPRASGCAIDGIVKPSEPLAPASSRRRPNPERIEPDAGDPRLRGIRLVTSLMDDAVEIPGTAWRVGLDPIVGLVPGVGDLATAIVSTWVLVAAWRIGAPASVLSRIVLNVGLDALAGVVPIAGDLFDFGFKANRRNLNLLERWLERPRETRRASQLAVAGLVVLMLVVVAAVGYAAWRLVAWAVSSAGW